IYSGTLFVTGNIIAQQFVKPRGLKSHNFYRILRLGGFGLCIGSIAYSIISISLIIITLENCFIRLLTRVTLDQAIFAPCFITTFFVGQALLEDIVLLNINIFFPSQYTQAFVPTLINNYKLWSVVQLLNFHFIPLNYRILVGILIYLLSIRKVPTK
ncbi:hypothetical protein GLOIN_2v1866179, partial [Rhizophagus irregularis DAOM 181602=DAOM 197198]